MHRDVVAAVGAAPTRLLRRFLLDRLFNRVRPSSGREVVAVEHAGQGRRPTLMVSKHQLSGTP